MLVFSEKLGGQCFCRDPNPLLSSEFFFLDQSSNVLLIHVILQGLCFIQDIDSLALHQVFSLYIIINHSLVFHIFHFKSNVDSWFNVIESNLTFVQFSGILVHYWDQYILFT